jgi:hypothetical protein
MTRVELGPVRLALPACKGLSASAGELYVKDIDDLLGVGRKEKGLIESSWAF